MEKKFINRCEEIFDSLLTQCQLDKEKFISKYEVWKTNSVQSSIKLEENHSNEGVIKQTGFYDSNFQPNIIQLAPVCNNLSSFEQYDIDIRQSMFWRKKLEEQQQKTKINKKNFKINEDVEDYEQKLEEMLNKSSKKSKEQTPKEILAKQRDYKRRRQKYRAKNVHITKRTPKQISKDLVELLMSQYSDSAYADYND